MDGLPEFFGVAAILALAMAFVGIAVGTVAYVTAPDNSKRKEWGKREIVLNSFFASMVTLLAPVGLFLIVRWEIGFEPRTAWAALAIMVVIVLVSRFPATLYDGWQERHRDRMPDEE